MSNDQINELLTSVNRVAMVLAARYMHDLGDTLDPNARAAKLAGLGYTTEQVASILQMKPGSVRKARSRHKRK